MNKTFLIVSREYWTRVRKKSFFIMTILGPLLLVFALVFPLILQRESEKHVRLLVVDENDYFVNRFQDTKKISFSYLSGDIDELKKLCYTLNTTKEYRQDADNPQQSGVQFKRYEDEPLSERIKNPRIEGNVIVMDIDNVPRVITLPNTTAAAYQSGALPLNTLANAILAKSDMMSNAQANVNQEQDISRRFEQKQEREQVRGIR